MAYPDWQRARADICLLYHEQMSSGQFGATRDFADVFKQPYHQFLDGLPPSEPDTVIFQRGALLMLLHMALTDIRDHRCDYDEIYSERCATAIQRFAGPDRVTDRLANIVRLAFEILRETNFETRATHSEYWTLQSHLPWVFDAVVVDYYRSMLKDTEKAEQSVATERSTAG